eukprot:superscaffoldBa00012823_g25789
MLKLDVLRLFVDQRLTAATDDIFRLFARTIAEYEDEVLRSKQEIDRQRKLLEAAGRPGDTPPGRWTETSLCCLFGLMRKMSAECVTECLFPARCRYCR